VSGLSIDLNPSDKSVMSCKHNLFFDEIRNRLN
jgi:hypothetical protein